MSKSKILIVDDEPIIISVLVEILSQYYELLVANDGMTALEILKTNRVDLVLLDILMPEMNGYEVAQNIKKDENTANIPFMFLSAQTHTENIVQGFREGAVDYVSKPFIREELLVRIQTHLQSFKLQNDILETNSFLDSILNSSTHAIIVSDISGTITLFNKSAQEMLGYDAQELVNIQTPIIFHDINEVEKRAKELSIEFNEEIAGFDTFAFKSKKGLENIHEWTYLTKNGERLTVNLSVSARKDINGMIIGYTGIAEDITKQKQQQKLINDYMNTIDENVITSTTDLNGVIVDVSQAFSNLSGYAKNFLIGKKHQVIKHQYNDLSIYKNMWETITQDKIWNGVLQNRASDGSSYWTELSIHPRYDYQGIKIGYIGIAQNITDKKIIEEMSITDELTKLHNRRYFNYIISNEINRLKRDLKPMAFLMIDVDYFKAYNDTYGHQKGDNVLAQIGLVLKNFSKRAGDDAFRLGGEEFVVIFSESTFEQANEFANKIRKSIENLKIDHSENSASNYVTVSIGMFYKTDLTNINVDDIYRESDKLLYQAKDSGRNRVATVLSTEKD